MSGKRLTGGRSVRLFNSKKKQIFRENEIQCSELRNQISALMSRAELLAPDRISVPPSGPCINPTFLDTDGTRTRED
ncbi:hypothetical protein GcM1_247056 [Golovinomyces cichoracearum]|uniref:Uncharacterized protein n=1 Tax=Golovinomyces cichoracearum TaxID=62708 RepID=A0A420IDG1_9PEZI|nr:hypothetical protein GcM1_247056 [Golovinomyces cichoracearum]